MRKIVAVAGSARGRRLGYVSSVVGVSLSLQGCMDPGGGLAVVPRIAPVMVTSSLVAMASYFYKLKLIKGIVDSVLELVDRAVKRVDQALEDNAEWLAEVVAMVARGTCVVIVTVTVLLVGWLVARGYVEAKKFLATWPTAFAQPAREDNVPPVQDEPYDPMETAMLRRQLEEARSGRRPAGSTAGALIQGAGQTVSRSSGRPR